MTDQLGSKSSERESLIDYLLFAYASAQDGEVEQAQAILNHCAAQADNLVTQADVAFYRGLIAREVGLLDEAASALATAQIGYEVAGEVYQAAVSASYRGRVATSAGRLKQGLDHHYGSSGICSLAVICPTGQIKCRFGSKFLKSHWR